MGKEKVKIYCYVDESGQDTAGRFFLVAIVIAGEERERMIQELEKIEVESLKGVRKWKTANHVRRLAYMEMVLQNSLFRGSISYAVFFGRKDYKEMTIIATAKAVITCTTTENYEVSVYVDGLGIDERFVVSTGLRQRSLHVKKVRGLTDESSALIRLADAVAGFIRDYMEGKTDVQVLYKRAVAQGLIKKL